MKCYLRYVQPTFIYREFNGMQLSSHLRVEGKNISQDAHLLSAGLDILGDDILGFQDGAVLKWLKRTVC